MDELVVVGKAQDGTLLYVSELSSFTLRENGVSGPADGLYLYEESVELAASGIRVLAKVADLGAAHRLLDMLIGSREPAFASAW